MALPEDVQVPTGFETVGQIAHLNLSEEQLPHRYIIGEILLQKTPILKTVITKLGHIHNVFRTFDMEILAGEESYESTQVEDGIKYTLDVSTVYWCSRLSYERTRLITEVMKPGEVICDMFGGVGAITVKAAKMRGIYSMSNDLNPDCFQYLRKNIVQNRVADFVVPYNMDAREFVREIVR